MLHYHICTIPSGMPHATLDPSPSNPPGGGAPQNFTPPLLVFAHRRFSWCTSLMKYGRAMTGCCQRWTRCPMRDGSTGGARDTGGARLGGDREQHLIWGGAATAVVLLWRRCGQLWWTRLRRAGGTYKHGGGGQAGGCKLQRCNVWGFERGAGVTGEGCSPWHAAPCIQSPPSCGSPLLAHPPLCCRH